ncbi:MAG: EF2563 family selenium-dependent molybdenum hydroxylase system protein [Megasphaera sp.]|jgi:xanthine dehydrogenase accessory factor|nr:EF2563 family selenium-dependent molybdenum hydroxylase system protein [Megasphaera sp.]MCH4187335.1 EF2563 family selenium-dependent molybdenum hydroxylase system protein [Megasphaera sp.]MCH4217517.1 EF2563 family selenium-dependent molybdenum hydroxylase system protein [Megasphaera sp.]
MLDKLIIVRGGGDLATGVVQALWRAGFPVLILEAGAPSAIRRQVALCEAVYDGTAVVEDIHCRRCQSQQDLEQTWQNGEVPLLVDPAGEAIAGLHPWAVVDAIIAKKNLGTTRSMAPKTIALGPGFTAGVDVDVVVETMRGHNLGCLIRQGQARPNTGVPGVIGGASKERVIHSPAGGWFYNLVHIGDVVQKGEAIAVITPEALADEVDPAAAQGVLVPASLTGIIRGLIRNGYVVTTGFKVADIDPRREEIKNCFTISDKARNLGGAVLTALLMLAREQT